VSSLHTSQIFRRVVMADYRASTYGMPWIRTPSTCTPNGSMLKEGRGYPRPPMPDLGRVVAALTTLKAKGMVSPRGWGAGLKPEAVVCDIRQQASGLPAESSWTPPAKPPSRNRRRRQALQFMQMRSTTGMCDTESQLAEGECSRP